MIAFGESGSVSRLAYNGRVLSRVVNSPRVYYSDVDWPDNAPSQDDPGFQETAPLRYWFAENLAELAGREYVLSDLLGESGDFQFNSATQFIGYLFNRFGADFTFSPANVYELPTVSDQMPIGAVQSIFDNDTRALARFKVYVRRDDETMASVLVSNGRLGRFSLGSFELGTTLRIAYSLYRQTETGGVNEGKTYTYFTGAINGGQTRVLTTEFVPFAGEEYSFFLTNREGTEAWTGPRENIKAVSWLDALGYHDYDGNNQDVPRWATRASMQDPFLAETPIPVEPRSDANTEESATQTEQDPDPIPAITVDQVSPTGYRWRNAGGAVLNTIGKFDGSSYQFQYADGLADIDYLVIEGFNQNRAARVPLSFGGVTLSADIRSDFATRTTVRYRLPERMSGSMASSVGATGGRFFFYRIYGERVNQPAPSWTHTADHTEGHTE